MRACFRLGVVASVVSLLGCGTGTPGVEGDSARAKYILVTALEAWREGRVNSLATRTPAIRFSDDDQQAGNLLIDYEFENESSPIMPFQNVAMVLSLKDRQGRTSQKNVTYQVGVEPVLTVLRSDN